MAIAALVAFSVQCNVLARLNARLQALNNAYQPAGGAQQGSGFYYAGCAVASVTQFCMAFGESLYKGSLNWVRPCSQSAEAWAIQPCIGEQLRSTLPCLLGCCVAQTACSSS